MFLRLFVPVSVSVEFTGPTLPGMLGDMCNALANFLFVEENRGGGEGVGEGEGHAGDREDDDVGFRCVTTVNKTTQHFNRVGAGSDEGCGNVQQVLAVAHACTPFEVYLDL